MSIINKFTDFKAMLFNTVKKTSKNIENDDEMLKLMNKCAKVLNDMAERQVPENNKFRKVFVAFDIPKTRNEALISISHDEIEPKNFRNVAVQVHNINSDKFYSKYIFKGTKNEVMNFIADTNNHKNILDTAMVLSKRVEEDYF